LVMPRTINALSLVAYSYGIYNNQPFLQNFTTEVSTTQTIYGRFDKSQALSEDYATLTCLDNI